MPRGGESSGICVSEGVVVVAPSTVGRGDRVEWWVSSPEPWDEWSSEISSKSSG